MYFFTFINNDMYEMSCFHLIVIREQFKSHTPPIRAAHFRAIYRTFGTWHLKFLFQSSFGGIIWLVTSVGTSILVRLSNSVVVWQVARLDNRYPLQVHLRCILKDNSVFLFHIFQCSQKLVRAVFFQTTYCFSTVNLLVLRTLNQTPSVHMCNRALLLVPL